MRLRQMRLFFFKYLLLVFILFVHSFLRFLNRFYLIFKYTSWRDFSELFLDFGFPADFRRQFCVLRRLASSILLIFAFCGG